MPYGSVSEVPDYVPAAHRAQWRAVWNSVYEREIKGGKTAEDAEKSAFAQANGVIKKQDSGFGSQDSEGATMSDQDYATVSGTKVHRSDFAYAPAGSGPSEWKLPIHDASHVRNALARWNQTDLPPDAKAGVWRKIVAAAHKFGVHVGEENRGSENREIGGSGNREIGESPDYQIARLPDGLSEVCNGLVRIAVAYTGKFNREGKEFEITPQDLEQMRANLAKREVPIDYEHLSAAGQAPPGWARAAGWLRRPAGIGPSGNREIGRSGDLKSPDQPITRSPDFLWAWAEFTPACLAMIKQKEYRYFSPEIHWKDSDEAGSTIGTRLAAGAMTNRPFLKDLPAIELSDSDYNALFGLNVGPAGAGQAPPLLASIRLSERAERLVSLEQIHVPQALDNISIAYPQGSTGVPPVQHAQDARATPKEKTMKNLKLKKFTEGEHAGKHMVMDGEEPVGEISAAELKAHFNKHLAEKEPDDDDKKMSEIALLTEHFGEGKVDLTKAAQLCDEGTLKPGAIFRAQEAERIVNEAIQAGRILPKRRKEAFALALRDPASFKALAGDLKAAVDTGSRGVPGNQGASSSVELTERVREYAKTHNCSIAVALSEFTQTAEGKRLWDEHSCEVVTAVEAAEEERE